jgi:hypothetical protein
VKRVGGDGGLASGARREEESCWTEEKRGGAGALRQEVSQGLSRPLNATYSLLYCRFKIGSLVVALSHTLTVLDTLSSLC